MSTKVLVVEDDRGFGPVLQLALTEWELEVEWLTRGCEALEYLRAHPVDVVVTDLRLRGADGIELCRLLLETDPELPVIVMTAFGSLDAAIDALRAGAYDFVPKPFEIEQLALAIRRASENRRLREEVRQLRRLVGDFSGATVADRILGTSPAIRRLRETIQQVAASEATTMIHGETGTGKELVARALHDGSPRREGPFVALNCAAIPETLIEAELFGHERGAFTDARKQRPGLFLEADGGTVFLDEIAEMPLAVQARLLRALQERRVRPLGGGREKSFDTRLLCATHRDIEAEVRTGRFREDLYFRLHVIDIHVPPLRGRGDDILLLAQHFLRHYASRLDRPVTGLTESAAQRLLAYPWPGNVRELEGAMERAVTFARAELLSVDDLPPQVRRSTRPILERGPTDDHLLPLAEVERRHIARVLEHVDGNKSRAAEILGVHRRTLYRKLGEDS